MRRGEREKAGTKNNKKERKTPWLAPASCILGSLVLYGVLTLGAEGQDVVSKNGHILRDGYGGEEQEYQLWVEGLCQETVAVDVRVKPRRYKEEEALDIFEEVMAEMEARIRGGNPSLMEVRSDLLLPSRVEEGVRLRWYSPEPEILDASGKLGREVESEQQVVLSVELSAGSCRQNYEIPVRILPPARSQEEQRIAKFQKELQQKEEVCQEEAWLALPEDFQGRSLRYQTREQGGYEAIILVGAILAVLLAMRGQSEEKQQRQKREKELLLDYSDVLSKLMVLIGAGLTVRNAWERMVLDYEAAQGQGRQKARAAYEEMRRTYYQMQSGMAEGEAYQEFGRRCRLQPYLKLSGLLEQNRRSGTKNMRMILQTEMSDALEQRKNLARRLGEEAGTKLLMPLFFMLGIIMVMIMVPAMMTMG